MARHRELARGVRTLAAGDLPRGRLAGGQRAGCDVPDRRASGAPAGQRVVLLPCEKRLRARATKVRPMPATIDGAAVALAADLRYQEVGVRFTSAGDQWVTATVQGPLASRSLTQLALTGPDGSTLVGLNTATVGSVDLWYLPEPGSYRLTARTARSTRPGNITVSSVRELDAEMPADGQPLAFTAQEPGEWVVATGQLDQPPSSCPPRPRVSPSGGRTRACCPSSCAVAPSAPTAPARPSRRSSRPTTSRCRSRGATSSWSPSAPVRPGRCRAAGSARLISRPGRRSGGGRRCRGCSARPAARGSAGGRACSAGWRRTGPA